MTRYLAIVFPAIKQEQELLLCTCSVRAFFKPFPFIAAECMLAIASNLLSLVLSTVALYRYRACRLKDVLLKQGKIYFLVTVITDCVPVVSNETHSLYYIMSCKVDLQVFAILDLNREFLW
jgi:hypothetical protein